MRRFYFIQCLMALFTCGVFCYSCSQQPQDFVTEQKSNTSMLSSEQFYSNMDTTASFLSINREYNDVGFLVKESKVNTIQGFVVDYTEFVHNSEGVLLDTYHYFNTNIESEKFILLEVINYEYDERGRLISKYEGVDNENFDLIEEFKYNKKDQVTIVNRFIDETKTGTIEYEYNSDNQIEHEILYDVKGFVLSWTEFKYRNHILKETEHFNYRGDLVRQKFFHYNTYNELIVQEVNDVTSTRSLGSYVIRYDYFE